MRTLVVGDVHGCLDELFELLQEADLDLSVDKLIMLGDYIDRGPKSYEVVEYLRDLLRRYGNENVILLRGNHEQMAIDYLEGNVNNWFNNGCQTTLDSLAANHADLSVMVQFFKLLPLIHADDYFIYVHSGLRPGIELENQRADDLLWIREDFFEHSVDVSKRVVFGHTPTIYINGAFHPIRWNRKVALDTGCVLGGYLSAAEINLDRIIRFYQVPSQI